MSLPFEDNFDLRPRPEWEVIIGNWRVVDGRLTTDPGDDWRRIRVGDRGWTDYALDVDVWSDDWFFPVRILVRAQDDGFMALETNIHGTDWIMSVDGSEHVIAHRDEGIESGRYEAEYHLRIETLGDIYTAYLDGAKLLQVQDTTISEGQIGLEFETSSMYIPTSFDNLRITSLP